MRENTIKEQINNRINQSAYGSVFVVSDFLDIADNSAIKQNLKRFADAGIIERVITGLYYKPKYSEIMKENTAVDINEAAKGIARYYNWTICPSGETALNMLGLSTQVPACYEYISSGPYKEYEIDGIPISFRHRSLKETQGFSSITALVIQSIKSIGKDNIIEKEIEIIKSKLSEQDKKLILAEGQKTTAWIYQVIKRICSEVSNV